MKSVFKKIISFITLLFLLFVMSGCKKYYIGDYECSFITESNDDILYLTNLSEHGRLKETIILPIRLNGYKVGVGEPGGILTSGRIEFYSTNLINIYFNSDVLQNCYEHGRNFIVHAENIFLPYYNKEVCDFNPHYHGIYYSYEYSQEENNIISILEGKIANVSYYYNYDNGYCKTYFIDDVDGDIIINKPPMPIRDGYRFGGWYKEEECINEWNFDHDMFLKRFMMKKKIIYIKRLLYMRNGQRRIFMEYSRPIKELIRNLF